MTEAATSQQIAELSESIALAHEYTNLVNAKVQAMDTFMDALLGTLGKTFPPLLPVLQDNLFALADVQEERLPSELRQQFRTYIADVDRKIEAVK